MPTTTNNNDFYDSLNTRPRETAKALVFAAGILTWFGIGFLGLAFTVVELNEFVAWLVSL